jgi:hypothetical protein
MTEKNSTQESYHFFLLSNCIDIDSGTFLSDLKIFASEFLNPPPLPATRALYEFRSDEEEVEFDPAEDDVVELLAIALLEVLVFDTVVVVVVDVSVLLVFVLLVVLVVVFG